MPRAAESVQFDFPFRAIFSFSRQKVALPGKRDNEQHAPAETQKAEQ